jgi:hypothetical protein
VIGTRTSTWRSSASVQTPAATTTDSVAIGPAVVRRPRIWRPCCSNPVTDTPSRISTPAAVSQSRSPVTRESGRTWRSWMMWYPPARPETSAGSTSRMVVPSSMVMPV